MSTSVSSSLLPVLDVYTRTCSTKLILDLLKRLAFCFGQQQYRENNTKDAESSEYPEGYIFPKRHFEVAGELGDDKGQEPADENCYAGSLSLDVRCEHLTHHCPWKWTPAYAVRSNENDECNHWQP